MDSEKIFRKIKKIAIIILINIGILFCLLIVFVTCLELYLRFLSDYPKSVDITPGYVRTHATRRYELVPNFQGYTYGVPLEINSAGYRGKLVDRENKGNNFRILIFGDSTCFGIGVKAEEALPALLEKKLNEQGKEAKFQVLNFCIPSYNTTREVEYIEDTGLSYDPDMVIVVFNLGDTEDSNYMKTSTINKYFLVRYIKDKLRHLYSYEVLASNFYNLLYHLGGYYVKEEEGGDVIEKLVKNAESYVRDGLIGWVKAKNSLKELADICEEKNIELAIMISPPPHLSAPNEYPYFPLLDKIKNEFNNLGIKYFINPLERMMKFTSQELRVKPSDPHFSLLAHQICADELFDELTKNNLVDLK